MTEEIAISGQTPSAAPPRRNWRRWLLIGSLAFNALFVGAAASAIWRFGGPPSVLQNVPGNLVSFVDTLPSAREKEVLPGGRELRATIAPLRRDLREARREVLAAIAATPFDTASYERAQTRLFEAETRLRNEQGQLLSAVLTKLTPEERRAYLRWHEHRRGHPRRGGGQRPDDDPPQKN